MENIWTVMAKRNSGMSCENLQVPAGFVEAIQAKMAEPRK